VVTNRAEGRIVGAGCRCKFNNACPKGVAHRVAPKEEARERASTVRKSTAMSIVEYLPTSCITLKTKTMKLTLGPPLQKELPEQSALILKENAK
jgi:hypothetical protein